MKSLPPIEPCFRRRTTSVCLILFCALCALTLVHCESKRGGALSRVPTREADSLKYPVIVLGRFEDMKLYKSKHAKGRNVLFGCDFSDTSNPNHVPKAHTSQYIQEHFSEIPDTIWATGYYIMSTAALSMMIEYDGTLIVIESFKQ